MPTFTTADLFGPSIAPTGVPGISFSPPPMAVNNALPLAIKNSAFQLGIKPVDLATAIGYETGGTFDPWQKGPTTKWGTHRGLIQFGEPQAAQYGVNANTPADEEMQAVTQYLKDAGVKPGMGLLDVYSAINAGHVGRYNASDRPGMTVAKHVDRMTQEYGPTAQAMIGDTNPPQPMALGPSPQGKTFSTAELFGGAPAQAPQQVPQTPAQPPEQPYQPTPWSEIANDAANSAISRGIGGLVGLAGMPGDIEAGGNRLMQYLNPEVKTHNYLPSTEDVNKFVTGKIGDYSYTPTTGAGEIAGDIFGYGTSGAGIGPGGAIKQGLNVLGTAGAGEVGRELGGTPGEVAAALVASHKLNAPTLAGEVPKVTSADVAASVADKGVVSPMTQAVKRASQENYAAANKAGLNIPGKTFYRFQQTIQNDPKLMREIDSLNDAGRIKADLKNLGSEVEGPAPAPKPDYMTGMTGNKPVQPTPWAPAPVGFENFDNIRRRFVHTMISSPDANERRVAGDVLDKLDNFWEGQVANVPGGKQIVDAARDNWRRYKKSAIVDETLGLADNASGQYTLSGDENAIRTKFKNLADRIIKNKPLRNTFTNDEVAQINKLARPTSMRGRQFFRTVGRFLNNSIYNTGVGAVSGVAAYGQGQDPLYSGLYGALGAGAARVGGVAARGIAGKMARNKANDLKRLIASGGQYTQGARTVPMLASGLAALNPYLGQ